MTTPSRLNASSSPSDCRCRSTRHRVSLSKWLGFTWRTHASVTDSFTSPAPESARPRRQQTLRPTGVRDGPRRHSPLGIEPSPTLIFDHPADDVGDHSRGVPFANTCTNCLHVPVLADYELFKERMMLALEFGLSFVNA